MVARLGLILRGDILLDCWFGQLVDYADQARDVVRRGVCIDPDDILLEPLARRGVLQPAGWVVSADPCNIRLRRDR